MTTKPNEKQKEVLYILKSVHKELEKHFKKQNLELKKAKADVNNMNPDEELDFLFERLRLFFKNHPSYLNLKRPVFLSVDMPKQITWDFVLDNLENHMRY